jgi:hypothetical protein
VAGVEQDLPEKKVFIQDLPEMNKSTKLHRRGPVVIMSVDTPVKVHFTEHIHAFNLVEEDW